ncbi:MAG: DUF502 domain-containing protein [Hyphomicrobiaceae bacterium]|nr:DUF502 domain-containing protein [Hyphomicrobiaceae bacterium]
MSGLASQFRTNIIYGAIALLPLAVLVYILVKLFGFLKKLAEPLSPYLSTNPYLDIVLLLAITIFALIGLCYFLGALINTQIGALSFEKVESRMSDVIPGYEIIANLLRGMAGNKMSYQPALITLSAPGTAVLGFVMEDEGDPYLTVFVPTAPIMTAGTIHGVERSRVRPIEGSSMDAANCVTQWGLGLKEFRGAVTPPKIS